MAKKLGCGGLSAMLVAIVVVLFIGANEAMGFFFEHCDPEDEDPFECFFNALMEDEEEEEPEGAVTAAGTYTYKDYVVNITANIPLGGGDVTGTVSGACDGRVKASFSGQNNGVISGKMMGTCDPFFVKVPASANFSGTVNKTTKAVPIQFDGNGGGFSHQGSLTLGYQ